MSQAEELLNSLTDDISVHTHSVTDSDAYFIIDPITHKIENTARKKRILMQRDHRSERFTFELPRYVEGHDMTLCDRVRVHYNNVGTATGAEEEEVEERADVVELTDLRINPDNTETVICSWLIERQSTQLVGILSFLVQYLCTDNGEVVYEWHSDIFEDIEIHKGRNNGEAAVIEYSNILEQWYTRIFGAGDSVMASIASESATQLTAIQAESEKQQSAIESKGAATLATIPEDYTETYNTASQAIRTRSNAIVLNSEGEVITINDSSDDYIRGLNLYGKSTQLTTTGKQLANNTNTTYTIAGITFTSNPDGSINISGTSTGEAYYLFDFRNDIPIKETELIASISGSDGVSMVIGYFTDQNTFINDIATVNSTVSKTFMYPAEAIATRSFLAIVAGKTINATVYPLIRLASIEDESYEPYTGGKASPSPEYPQEIKSIGNDGSAVVNVYGSNLLDYETWKQAGSTYATATFVDNGVVLTTEEDKGDGFTNYVNKYSKVSCVPGVKYILSWEHSGANGMVYIFPNGKVDNMISVWTNEVSQLEYVPADGVEYFTFRVGVSSPAATGTYKNVRINVAKARDFEPYRSPQTITIPHTLPGISVSDGQQRICDEVDYERGVYVQRIYAASFDGSETITLEERSNSTHRFIIRPSKPVRAAHTLYGFCSHFTYTAEPIGYNSIDCAGCIWTTGNAYVRYEAITSADDMSAWLSELASSGNPLTIVYALETPIETPLTAEELEAFKTLHTNYPNTTILNDQSAYMKVSYNADTKTYVDNKIAEAVAQYLATA